MMAKIHEVKLHAKYFDLVLEGKKRAEFRKKDRNYERGDMLILHEWVQGVFTGRKVEARITDVTDLSDWLEDYVLLHRILGEILPLTVKLAVSSTFFINLRRRTVAIYLL
ncbi:DUF3850 domain-containing protein [Escherichia coli]|nr:DUF3850 domain-containing protein [Escherichia coli]